MSGNGRREILLVAVLATLVAVPCLRATEEAVAVALYIDPPPPEVICEKMSEKLLRGITNVATSPLEVPKQVYYTTRDHGVVTGPFLGLLKGVGMTAYRAVVGTFETAFFFVPAPGYYDPMAHPTYVWGD